MRTLTLLIVCALAGCGCGSKTDELIRQNGALQAERDLLKQELADTLEAWNTQKEKHLQDLDELARLRKEVYDK